MLPGLTAKTLVITCIWALPQATPANVGIISVRRISLQTLTLHLDKGGKFKMTNGQTYSMINCGVAGKQFELHNSDDSFNSYGHYTPDPLAGRGCNNKYGSFKVEKQWSFY
jgi:hypothetical protein